jgi:hypothetical protein
MNGDAEYFPEEPAPPGAGTEEPSAPEAAAPVLPEPTSEFRVTPKEFHCPACGRLVYSRRLKKCGFCGLPLPPEFLLTEAEIEVMDQERREMQERRKRDKEKEEEERKKQQSAGDGGNAALFFG